MSFSPYRQTARMLRTLVAGLVAASLLLGTTASAESLQQQLERVRERAQKVERETKAREGRLQELKAQVQAAAVTYNRTQQDLERAKAELARKEQEVRDAEARVKQTDIELQEVMSRLSRQQQQLAGRVKSLYMDGRVEYLEVLLGSASFSDFLGRFRMLQAVVKNDSRLVLEVKATRAEVEFRRAQAQQERNRLVALRTQARQSRDKVAGQMNEVARVKRDLTYKEAQERQALDQLERESKQLEKDIRSLEEKIARELGKLVLSYPVSPARKTSDFGRRFHPILREYRLHNGTDFAASTGQKVFAAADGTVIVSQWQAGYGNVVVISHGKVNGKAVSTLYAHNSRLRVEPGQKVKRGDTIALAGSTGMSTGPHVHFEVRLDGTPVDPLPWFRK